MGFGRYFRRVLRWWWLILLSTGIAAGASYLASSQQPAIYETTTTLIVGQVTQKVNPTFEDFAMTEQLGRSYAQIASRQPVLQAVVDSLGLEMPWQELQGRVVVYPVEGTQLMAITVWDTSPERVVAIADEIAYQLIQQSPTSPENKARQERSQFVQNQLNELEARIKVAQTRLEELKAELDTAFSARQIQDLQTEITNLEGLINTWQANYTNLLSFLEGGNQTNLLAIIEPAQLPYLPISPNIPMNVILAAATGFMLTLGAVLLLEYLDDTVKSADDLNASVGLTSLGSVSRIKGTDYQGKLITSHNSLSPITEAYRLVRTNIQFMAINKLTKSIMVTSPNPNEGKSITAANLGVIMAQANIRTIIVDADLRRPAMHKIFQVSNLEGLTTLLRSPELEIGRALKSVGVENLQVITSGPLPPNPVEMLGSSQMVELLHRLAKLADVIILDSSPILPVTDAIVVANRVDSVLLVVEVGRTRYKATRQAIERLHQAGANILGGLLNRVSGPRGVNARYLYSHSGPDLAGQPGAATPQRRWWRRQPVSK